MVKTVKKVFKKVVNVVKKIIKPVLIAAAVYFTAGIALAAFAPTAGFAASMPLFASGGSIGLGIGAGATAGTGIFSQAAVAIGIGGGLTSGALSAGTTVAQLSATYGASTAIGAMGGAGMLTGAQAAGAQATIAGNAAAITAGTGAVGAASNIAGMGGAAPASGLIPKAAQAVGKMSFSDKLLMTKIGTDVAGSLFGPTPAEEAEALAIEQAKFRGAFYGMDADGSTGISEAISNVQEVGRAGDNEVFNQAISRFPPNGPQAPNVPQMNQAPGQGGSISPEQQALLEGRDKKSRFPGGSARPGMTSGPGAMQSQLPVPEGLFSPAENVRYV